MRTRRRLANSTLIVLTAPVAAFLVHCARAQAPAEQPGVIPDSHGAIAEILLQFDATELDEIAPVYDDLFSYISDGVDVRVLSACDESTSEFLARWGNTLEQRGHDVTIVEIDRPISIWARDRHIARCDPRSLEPDTSFVPIDAGWYSE
ncbi:MAG: hypothetical protein ACYTGR_16810, partial [Planctomycetota bacterium]